MTHQWFRYKTNGRKYHIVNNQKHPSKSLCQMVNIPTRRDGEVNRRMVQPLNQLQEKPAEEWCSTCAKKYAEKVEKQ